MKKYLIITAMCILAAGCVTDNTPTSGQQAQEYLKIWMDHWNTQNGKNVQPTDMGLYILEDIPGPANAAEWSAEHPYTYASITIRTLNGTISATADANLAKQIGTYEVANYYGPSVFSTGDGVSYAGVDEALKGMRMGGTRTVVIPAWMLTTSRYDSLDKYLESCSSTTNYIYTFTPVEQFDDTVEWEKQQIKDYINAKYPGQKSTTFPDLEEDDGTFWIITDESGFDEADKRLDTDTDLRVHYTGYRLDGTIFDTSIETVAIDNDVWSSSRTYGSESIAYAAVWSDIKVNSSSYIDGFKAALSMMWWAGQKATVIFTSTHGYGTTGSGNAIPAYCPLVFDLELTKE